MDHFSVVRVASAFLKIPTIWYNNKSTIELFGNLMLHASTKHIDLDIYFVRKKIQQKILELEYIPTTDQIADILSKALSSFRFLLIKNKLRVESLVTLSLRGDVKQS